MDQQDTIKKCIQYCLKLKKLRQEPKVARKIATALYESDRTQEDINNAIILLNILKGE